MQGTGLIPPLREQNENKSMDAIAEKVHSIPMHGVASSSVEKGKPEGLAGGVLLAIQVVLALVLGWFGVNALLDVVRESRHQDEATVQGFIDSHRQEDEHRQAATPSAVKAVAAPVSTVKAKGVLASPPAKAQPQPSGRHDAKAADQKIR